MKMNMKEFNKNLAYGTGVGIVTAGVMYFINKKYMKTIDEDNTRSVELHERLVQMELDIYENHKSEIEEQEK